MSGDLEGRIAIYLSRDRDGQIEARIESTRPQLAQPLMAGRTPAEAARLAESVFSLCGRAQGLAAELATAAACGREAGCAAAPSRFRRALAEVAVEHAWQLLVNLPAQLGDAPDLAAVLTLRQAAGAPEQLADRLEDVLRERVLGEPAGDWLQGGPAALERWSRAAPTSTARRLAALGDGRDRGISRAPLLPTLAALGPDDAGVLAREALEGPSWCARPLWHERPAETGAIARLAAHPRVAYWLSERGRGVGARLLARLLELTELPARLRREAPDSDLARAWSPAPGVGVAGVETARGLLLHVARVLDDRVAEYRIVAPTEWNFHPAGPIAEALAALTPDGDLLEAAGRIAHSLDACVAIEVRRA